MILVDTSVWIDFFNQPDSPSCRQFEGMLKSHTALCINGIIRMEILQGVKKDRDFHRLQDFLEPFLYFKDVASESLDLATQIYRTCRRRGLTIRKSVDCIIAADALSHGLQIFHRDRDFTAISLAYPELSVLSVE